MMIRSTDIIFTNVMATSTGVSIAQAPADQSLILTKLQLSLDSNAGLATVTAVIANGTIPLQRVTVTPGSPTYVEQEYTYGILRISPGNSLLVYTESGSVSVTVGYYFAYGRVSST
ncbi:MAG: hypothetical protein QXL70_02010 [Metallosphaera sp.]